MAQLGTRAPSSGPLSAFSFLSFGAQKSIDEEEPDHTRDDIEGLVQHLTHLRRSGIRLIEVQYAINKWALYGFIPMTHHGFSFKTSRGDYFTLDFGRRGIVWDVMDLEPENPDNTFYTKTYKIDMDTAAVQKYCEDTPPFNYPFYDCETWAKGLLVTLALDKSPDDSKRFSKNACAPSAGPTSVQSPVTVRRTRAGDCI